MTGIECNQKDLVLLVVTTAPTNQNYNDGAEQVYCYLNGQGHSNSQVQVRHQEHWQNIVPSSERLSDTAVEQYEAVSLKLRVAVEVLLGPLACGFSLYMRKRPGEDPKPTVVVLVKPGSTHNWAKTKAVLKRGLSDRDCYAEVELLPGRIQDA